MRRLRILRPRGLRWRQVAIFGFCSKFIAKFKIITSAVLATPYRLTMRVNLSARNIQSARNAIKSRYEGWHGRRGDTTQRRERIGYFGYEGRERAAYRGLKISRAAYLQL